MRESRLPLSRPFTLLWIALNAAWVFLVGRITVGFMLGIFRDARSEVADKVVVAAFVPPIALLGIVAAGVMTTVWLLRFQRYLQRRRTP